jgi:hypothetical protein
MLWRRAYPELFLHNLSLHVPRWGTFRDAPFLGPLREEKNFFIEGNFYEKFGRYIKTGSSLHGGPVGEPGGFRLLELLRK